MKNSGFLYSVGSVHYAFSKSLSRDNNSFNLLSFNEAVDFAADNLFFNSYSAAVDYVTRLCAIHSGDSLKYTLSCATCKSDNSLFIVPLDFVVYVS